MIRTSIVPTIVKGGYLKNVIPSAAEATVDIRALPHEDPEELFPRLKRIMNEPNVDLMPHAVTRPKHQPSSLKSDVFRAFEKVLDQRYPGILILPRMSTGATDSAQLRAAGIESYGFGPGRAVWDLAGGIHGKDEYLYVEPFQDYVENPLRRGHRGRRARSESTACRRRQDHAIPGRRGPNSPAVRRTSAVQYSSGRTFADPKAPLWFQGSHRFAPTVALPESEPFPMITANNRACVVCLPSADSHR